jgi:glutathione peroxidase
MDVDPVSFGKLEKYNSKAVLIVNIATKCGYTPQLEGLEALHKKYKNRGLSVIGVPSNNFGGQNPEDHKGTKDFCKLNYGVSFPIWKKQDIKPSSNSPLYDKLVKGSTGKKEVSWNFEKFLLDENFKLVKRFESKLKPEAKELKDAIEGLLEEP